MAIKIISTHTPTQALDLGHLSIDLSRKTAVLIRQSKKKADKDHYESRLLQENLVPIAMYLRGETDTTNILVYDEGAGISGTKGYDERKKLSELYLAIANDIIGSVVVARADRLFRDKHFLNVSMFTDLAERKHVILIVPGKCVYDFTSYNDLKAFQKDMQDAYNFIATQLKYMQDARSQKMQRGLYGGSLLPAPYVIDKNAWKDEQIPIIYQPWLEPAIDLFRRFKAYDFSIAHLCRYIESVPYLFPSPSFEDTQRYLFKTMMRLTAGGYTLSHYSNVRGYLINLTLGGYAKIGKDEDGNTLLIPNAFEAAIPFDLLDPAYAAITGSHIDGTPFEGSRNTRRYMRCNPQGPNALLHGILSSDQGHVNVMPQNYKGKRTHEYRCYKGLRQEGYTLKMMSGMMKTDMWWALPSHELDRIVFARLCDLADHDPDMAGRVKAAFESMQGQEVNEANLLNQQIAQTQERIKRLDYLLTTPSIPLDEATATNYALDLAELRQKLPRLLKKQQAQPAIDPGKTIADFYFVLSHLPTEFQKQGIDVRKQIMSKLVKQATINNISPHLFHLYIVWHDGIATRPDVALLWRGIALKNLQGWSEEEDALLRALYPRGSQQELMRSLPRRSWILIRERAEALKAFREVSLPGRRKTHEYYATVSYADLEAAIQYAENGEDEAYLCAKVNELAQKTVKGKMTAYWPLPLDIVGFSSVISTRESTPMQGRKQVPRG
jgi:DNA invertase Pin-like site-specific DNA recombinase